MANCIMCRSFDFEPIGPLVDGIDTPVNIAPPNNATGVGLTSVLEASAFSHSDGDTHFAWSAWSEETQFRTGPEEVLPGDANGDSVINIFDMTKVARIILQLD